MLSALLVNELDYVTILPFIAGAATRGLPVKIVAATVKTSGYAIISRPDAERFYAIYRDQYNPDLTVADSVDEELIAVGTFRAQEKISVKPSLVYDWTFAERARR